MKKKQYLIHFKCQILDKAISYSIDGESFYRVFEWANAKNIELNVTYKNKFRIIGIYEILYDVEKFNKVINTKERLNA